jgi:hypothetical protein
MEMRDQNLEFIIFLLWFAESHLAGGFRVRARSERKQINGDRPEDESRCNSSETNQRSSRLRRRFEAAVLSSATTSVSAAHRSHHACPEIEPRKIRSEVDSIVIVIFFAIGCPFRSGPQHGTERRVPKKQARSPSKRDD